MARWRYLAADLRTNTLLGELPAEKVSFGWELNGSGALSCTVRATDVTAPQLLARTLPARTAVYVDLDGVLVWGGIIWKRDYDSTRKGYGLQCSGFASYLSKRLITAVRNYVAYDQLGLARDLATFAQSISGANIGVIIGSETSATTRDVIYDPGELRVVLTEIAQLSAMVDGFDYRVDVGYDSSGLPAKYLRFGAPRLGLTTGASPYVVEYPGRIGKYTLSEDGDRMATTIWGRSTIEPGATITLTSTNPAAVSAGYPVLELPRSYPDVKDATRLQALIDKDMAISKAPVSLLTADVGGGGSPGPGDVRMGDNVRVRITDPLRFPAGPNGEPGLDRALRTIAATVTPAATLASTITSFTFGDALI